MVYTDRQIVDIIGWINFKMNFVNVQIALAINDPTQRPAARIAVRDALLVIYKVMLTIGTNQGFTMPTVPYTDEELAALGVPL